MKRFLAVALIVIAVQLVVAQDRPFSGWTSTANDSSIQYRWKLQGGGTYSGAPPTKCWAEFRDLNIKSTTDVSYRYDLTSGGRDYSNNGDTHITDTSYGVEPFGQVPCEAVTSVAVRNVDRK